MIGAFGAKKAIGRERSSAVVSGDRPARTGTTIIALFVARSLVALSWPKPSVKDGRRRTNTTGSAVDASTTSRIASRGASIQSHTDPQRETEKPATQHICCDGWICEQHPEWAGFATRRGVRDAACTGVDGGHALRRVG